jgi:5-methylcytosine-specific restriction endonuclease McrBC GTP-binding regulatory subunit McrB
LLDRAEDGFSEYPIACSPDLKAYLRKELSGIIRLEEYNEKTGREDFSQMTLPNNLSILCTMNTSDQSLFPMDSAFKRRWDWQYIPINYSDANQFEIDLEDGGEKN